MAKTLPQGALGERMALRKLSNLASELIEWRSDHEIRQADKAGGGVFDFVKGLRLATRLVYILKNKLSEYSLDANWGQILDENGEYLSPECDIIIHKGKEIDRWDGEGGDYPNVMDFRFIEIEKVVCVISCKSYLTSISERYTKYCQRLRPYLKGRPFWLFAECVPTGKEKDLHEKAKEIGHNRLWYLYSWDEKNLQPEENRPLWKKFLQEIDRIGVKDAG